MAERDPKTGRFVARPVLHRQVENYLDGAQYDAPEWLQSEPKPADRWPWVFLISALILVAMAGAWLAAVDGGLL